MVFTMLFFEIAIKSWHERDLNPQAIRSVETL